MIRIDNAKKNNSNADVVPVVRQRIQLYAVAFFLSAGSLLPSLLADADNDKNLTTAYQLKAAFLYNFMKFVEWPDNSSRSDNSGQPPKPFVLCVLGEDSLKAPLNSLADKTIKDRPVKVLFIDSFETVKKKNREATVEDYLDQLQKTIVSCHLLFVGAAEKERLAEILKLSEKKPILTVSDISNFASLGGVIEFVTENNKMRFDINLISAEAKTLKISSQLLQLARKVYKKETARPTP